MQPHHAQVMAAANGRHRLLHPHPAPQGPAHPAQRVPASGLAASRESPPSPVTGYDPTPHCRPMLTARGGGGLRAGAEKAGGGEEPQTWVR